MINIYKISNNFNDKIYIGQTAKTIDKRFKEHCSKSNHCWKMIRAIKKYGKENFKIELLTTCEGQECANTVETFYIAANNSVKNGYNILEIGLSSQGYKHTKEAKLKMIGNKNGRGNKGQIIAPQTIEANIKARRMKSKLYDEKIISVVKSSNLSSRKLGKILGLNHTQILQIRKKL
jgi:group I intron endonuclease